jgi:multidrug efflux pump subunit AcrA (membrane-fusion protein)
VEKKLSWKEKGAKTISIKNLKTPALKIESSKAALKVYGLIGKIPVMKKVQHLSLKKRRVIFTSIFLAAVLGLTTAASGYFGGDAEALTYTEYKVAKGDVTVAISGEGTVEPIDQYSVISLVEGDVLEDTFKEGDTVSKGALLYKIDSSDMEKNLLALMLLQNRCTVQFQIFFFPNQ